MEKMSSSAKLSPRSTTLRHLQQQQQIVMNEKAQANQGQQRTVPIVNLLPHVPAADMTTTKPLQSANDNNNTSLFLRKPKSFLESNNNTNNVPSVIAVARESSYLSSGNEHGRRSSGTGHSCAACGAPAARTSGGGGTFSNTLAVTGNSSSPKSSARASHLLSKIGQAVSATVEQTTHQISQQAGLSARHLHEAMGNALEWQQQHEQMQPHYYDLSLTPSEQQLLVVAKAVEQHRLDPLSSMPNDVIESSNRSSFPTSNKRAQKTAKFIEASSVRQHHATTGAPGSEQKPHSIAEAKLLGPRPQQLLNERFSTDSTAHHQLQRFRPVTHFDEPECAFRISGSGLRSGGACLSTPVLATGSTAVHRVPPATQAGVYHPLPAELTLVPDHHHNNIGKVATTLMRSESSPMKSSTRKSRERNVGSGAGGPSASVHHEEGNNAPGITAGTPAGGGGGGVQLRVQDSSSETKLVTLQQQRSTATALGGGGGGINEGFLHMVDAALLNTSFELYAPRSTPPPPLSVVLEAQQRLRPKNPSLLHVPTPSAAAFQIVAAPPVVVPVQPSQNHHHGSSFADDADDILARISDNTNNVGGRLPSNSQRREFFSTNPWLAETRQRFRRYFIFVYVSLAIVMLLFWLENIVVQTQLHDKVALQNADYSVNTYAYQLLLTSLGQEAQFSVWNSADISCNAKPSCEDEISLWHQWTDASVRVAYEYNDGDPSNTTQAITAVHSATSSSATPDEVHRQYFDIFAALTLGPQQPPLSRDFDIMRSAYLYYLLTSFSTAGAVVLYPQRVTNSTAYQQLQMIFCSSLNVLKRSVTSATAAKHDQFDAAGRVSALLFSADDSSLSTTAYAPLQTLRVFIESTLLLPQQDLDQFHALPADQKLLRQQYANTWTQYVVPWSREISRIAFDINLVQWFPQRTMSFDEKIIFLRSTVEHYRYYGIPTGGTSSEIFGFYWRNGLRIELFFIIPVLLMLFAVVFLEWRSRGTLGVLLTILFEAVYDASRTNVEMERARAISHRLILYHFPPAIAKRLFDTNVVMPESYLMSTIMFVEIDSFNLISQYSTPTEIVRFLDGYYETLESLLRRHPLVTQIHTTLMSTHLLASGIPTRTPAHAFEACTVALEILRQFYYFCIPHFVGPYGARSRLHLRVGCHSGTAVAAVVGVNQIRYSVFGDTVNLASRMQDYGYPRLCVMSRDTFRELEAYDPEHGSSRHFITKSRGEIRMKGKGRVAMMWLLGSARLQFSLDVKKEKYLYNVHCLAMHKPTECVLFRPGKGGA